MKILVVGGAGYIGSFVTMRLLESGHNPVVIDNLSTGNRASVSSAVAFYEGDIGDKEFVQKIFRTEAIELVMHLAAKISVPESISHPEIYYRNNVANVLVLLDEIRKSGCNKFIFSSTAAVYGNPVYLPVDEKHTLNPINPYGRSKIMLETILEDYAMAFGLRCVIFRYFNAAGGAIDGMMGESQMVKQNLIPIALDNLEHGRPTTIFGSDYSTKDGTCVRDFIHISDIAEAHIKAIKFLDDFSGLDVFNLGSEKGTSVKEVLDAISRVSNRRMDITVSGRRPGDPEILFTSNAKAKAKLGWEPVNSDIETIVHSAYQWCLNRRY